ncbi:MAG TPA: DUF2953 domain-containing protein [Clostridia bacterium]|nr:DUF2953 domain-containing protein [Clostridia bacterium]
MPLIVTGAVVLGILILLMIPVGVYASYDGKTVLKVKILFFQFRMIDEKTGKAKTGKKKKKKERKQREKPEKTEQKQPLKIPDLIRLIEQFSDPAKKLLRSFPNLLTVRRLKFRLTVCEQDAALTAMLYGGACAAVYPALSFLISHVRVKKHQVEILPHFQPDAQNAGSKVEFETEVSARPLSLLAVTIRAAAGMAAAILKNRARRNRTNKMAKGGAVK